ncbi:efflux RND transporter periplasmic adaptor subunit [Fodinicurvata fenggangensis]|uniref:efflux RND transporter periplasmic adaptor subunit n=1 Tax=Fodinicurvata fenggangensis TaxID=1121830 RepID=UPI00138DDA7A|nr:efflux RND transporter periplasmic adaptor subunit [Fodinicurvata fenggangensis]
MVSMLRYLFAAGLAMVAGTTALAQEDRAVVVVKTTERADIIEQVPLTGTVTSPRVSPVSSEIAGRVSRMHVEGGSHVEKGEALVELDGEFARLTLRQAEAAAREAQAALVDAQRRLNVAQRLVGQRAVSETELRTRETEVETDRAVLEGLQAEREEQALRLERHEITAPFSGVISRRMTEVGAWVAPGAAVVELVAMDGLRIDVPVPQDDFPRLAEDMEISVDFEAIPGEAFKARLESSIPVADPSARTFTARVVLEDGQVTLTPGMSARVTLHLATGERDPVIPRDALIRYPDGRTAVWTVEDGEDGLRASERLVETGLAFDGQLQIREGLEAGERVVVEGNEGLRPGQAVRLDEDTP